MKAIVELERMGFTFTLEGDNVKYAHRGDRPHPERVRPMLEYLKRHRDEAVRFLRDQAFETRADTLLACCDGSVKWAREWAELHDRWGVPCYGFDSWAEWAESIPEESGAGVVKQQFNDPPPTVPCHPFGTGEHRRFWRRMDEWDSGWICAICYPPPAGVEVETWEIPA